MDDQDLEGRRLLARLDRIPIWPYPKHIMATIGIGFFFAFYDIIIIGLSLPSLQHEFHKTLPQVSWAITSGLIGYIIGSFADSRISELFGRKISLYLSVSAFTIGSILCAISTHLEMVIVWRLISGMGIGAEIATVTTYMEELSPACVRGKATSQAIAFGMLGFAVVPFVALYLIPNFIWGWRALFLTGALGGVTIFVMRFFTPESPRWLFIKGKMTQVAKIVIAAEHYAQKKLSTNLPPPDAVMLSPVNRDSSLMSLTQSPFNKRIALFASIWFVYYIGNYGWLTLSTSLFYYHGFQLSKSIGFVAISSLGFVLGSILATLFADKFERKQFAFFILLGWILALLIVGWFPKPIVIIIAGFVATTTIAMLIPILYIYTGENFPTRIRATSVSVTDGLGHLGGAFCAQIVFSIASLFHDKAIYFGVAFTVMALSGVLAAMLLLFGIKMTTKSLSELAKY